MTPAWEFIMQASGSYDLYGRGKARILVDREFLAVVYYYRLDRNFALL